MATCILTLASGATELRTMGRNTNTALWTLWAWHLLHHQLRPEARALGAALEGGHTIEVGDLDLGAVVGRGSYSVVHQGAWRGVRVAVKVWDVSPEQAAARSPSADAEDAAAQLLHEVALLTRLRHPNIATVFGAVRGAGPARGRLMMVMAFASRGSLARVLEEAASSASPLAELPWLARRRIATSVAAGVEFLHAQQPPVAHCDLKCGNVLLDDLLNPQVADFGLAAVLSPFRGDDVSTKGGTLLYLAPEALQSMAAGEVAPGQALPGMPSSGGSSARRRVARAAVSPQKLDCYAFGCILYELWHLAVSPGGGSLSKALGASRGTKGPFVGDSVLLDHDIGYSILRVRPPVRGSPLAAPSLTGSPPPTPPLLFAAHGGRLCAEDRRPCPG